MPSRSHARLDAGERAGPPGQGGRVAPDGFDALVAEVHGLMQKHQARRGERRLRAGNNPV